MNLKNMKTLSWAFAELHAAVVARKIRGVQHVSSPSGLYIDIDRGRGLRASVTVVENGVIDVMQGSLTALVSKFDVTVNIDSTSSSPTRAIAQAQLHMEAAVLACELQSIVDDWTVGTPTCAGDAA